MATPLETLRQCSRDVTEQIRGLHEARAALREAVIACYEEKIPISVIAREAGVSRQWIYELLGKSE